MILRLSQKLNAKIKAGKLSDMPMDENAYADLFSADRTQYIIHPYEHAFALFLRDVRTIADDGTFISRALDTIRDFTADDGKQLIYRKFIAPSAGTVTFTKALNRSVTGSMNDHVHAAKFMLADDMAPSEIGYRLNQTPNVCVVWTG